MIGYLEGIVKTTHPRTGRVLIQAGPVGYWVHTGSWQPSGEVEAFIHHHIREDMDDLYGFVDLPTLDLFEEFLKISGIGPKAALALLSLGSIGSIREAIAQQNVAFLTKAPGIGQKAAQKIVLELVGRIDTIAAPDNSPAHEDIKGALESLGYAAKQYQPILSKLPKELTGLDEQLRWVLKEI